MSIIGWKLHPLERIRLLSRITPNWPDVIADHITLDVGARRDAPLPIERAGKIVGMADDGVGLQALVVAIGGTTKRPDGNHFHITWSLDRRSGRRPAESNILLSAGNFELFNEGVALNLIPAKL